MASSVKLRQIGGMNLKLMLNQNFLWASMVWSAIGSGYLLYGWRQKASIPLVGGVAMTAASFFLPALWMTLAGLAIMYGVWWLLKEGY